MHSDGPIVACIVVRRNQSLTATGFTGFLALGFAMHLGLGLFAGLEGWWPIVAFLGAGFLAMAGAVYAVMASAASREVITVRTDTVTVEYGRNCPRARMVVSRFGARIVYESDSTKRLLLQSRGLEIELGSALPEGERRSLARRLAEVIGPNARYADAQDAAVAPA